MAVFGRDIMALLKGEDGSALQIRVSDGYIQWKLETDSEWNNVIAISELKGENGITPHIGENGNWFIGDTDTGIKARGESGQRGNSVIEAELPSLITVTAEQFDTSVGKEGEIEFVNKSDFAVGDIAVFPVTITDLGNCTAMFFAKIISIPDGNLLGIRYIAAVRNGKDGADGQSVVSKEAIATALGIEVEQIEQIAALSKVLYVSAEKVQVASAVEALSFTEIDIIPYSDDDFVCGYSGLDYELKNLTDKGVDKVEINKGKLILPSSVAEKNVTGVANGFASYKNIVTSLTIPDGIKRLGGLCCAGSPIKEIIINTDLNDFGQATSYTPFISVGGEGFAAIFGDNVTKLPSYMFYKTKKLKSVTIGRGVTTIKKSFREATGLIEINYNAVDATIEETYPFESAGSTTDNIIFNIGEGVKKIPAYLMSSAAGKIKKLTISNSVEEIGDYALYGAASDVEITYQGTTEQWSGVNKGNGWTIAGALVHCSDGDVSV